MNIGRYQRQQPADDPYNEGIYFRSTVVSRKHGKLSLVDGQLFISDTKSLGGTFVNSMRLSAAGKESKPCKILHGDVIQFGVDYRPDSTTGQVRNKDRCVEVRVEFPKWAKKNKNKANVPKPQKWVPAEHKYTECCICLSALYERQALFIAPCSHTFHYRCIAPLVRTNGFSCPLCRQESDLHASLFSLDSEEDEDDESEGDEAVQKDRPTTAHHPQVNGDDIEEDNEDAAVERQMRSPMSAETFGNNNNRDNSNSSSLNIMQPIEDNTTTPK